jgi:hypothetical protein
MRNQQRIEGLLLPVYDVINWHETHQPGRSGDVRLWADWK